MRSLGTIVFSAAMAAALLSGCGRTSQQTSRTKDVANCHSIFSSRVYISTGGYDGYLTVYPRGLGLGLASISGGDGLEAQCGRSDVDGSLEYSYVPFTADYTLTLNLTSASCGDQQIVISGDCEEDGTASAELDGSSGYLQYVP